jgi:hypothetical protein
VTQPDTKFPVKTIVKWRFAESEEDGEVWLRNPALLQGYVDFESRSETGQSHWRRVMVVTRAWLEAQVQGVRRGDVGPQWAALPPMIVLPDAPREELRGIVDTVIRQGGFDSYSTPLSAGD